MRADREKEAVAAVIGMVDGVAVFNQSLLYELGHPFVIFDQQNLHFPFPGRDGAKLAPRTPPSAAGSDNRSCQRPPPARGRPSSGPPIEQRGRHRARPRRGATASHPAFSQISGRAVARREQRDGCALSALGRPNGSRYLRRRRHRSVADPHDHIAARYPAFVGGTAGGHRRDVHALLGRPETQLLAQRRRKRRQRHSPACLSPHAERKPSAPPAIARSRHQGCAPGRRADREAGLTDYFALDRWMTWIKAQASNVTITVRTAEHLHAKVIWTDRGALISSANLTSSGYTANVELGVRLEADEAFAQRSIRHVLEQGSNHLRRGMESVLGEIGAAARSRATRGGKQLRGHTQGRNRLARVRSGVGCPG